MHYRATSLHVINNIVNLTWIWRLTSNVIENNCTYTNLGAAMQWVFSYNIMTYITCDWLNLSILYFYIIFFILYFLYYILLFLYYKNILYFYFYFLFFIFIVIFYFLYFFQYKTVDDGASMRWVFEQLNVRTFTNIGCFKQVATSARIKIIQLLIMKCQWEVTLPCSEFFSFNIMIDFTIQYYIFVFIFLFFIFLYDIFILYFILYFYIIFFFNIQLSTTVPPCGEFSN